MNCGNAQNIERLEETFSNERKLIVPVLSDAKAHWCVNRLSFAYIFNIRTYEELLLGFNHNDLHKFDPNILENFLLSETYIYKKKYIYDIRGSKNGFDAEMVFWYKTNQRFNINVPQGIRQYWNDFKGYSNVNDFIPIMKYLEYCREIRDNFLIQLTDLTVDESFISYQKIIDNLVEIEKNGIYTNTLKNQ